MAISTLNMITYYLFHSSGTNAWYTRKKIVTPNIGYTTNKFPKPGPDYLMSCSKKVNDLEPKLLSNIASGWFCCQGKKKS